LAGNSDEGGDVEQGRGGGVAADLANSCVEVEEEDALDDDGLAARFRRLQAEEEAYEEFRRAVKEEQNALREASVVEASASPNTPTPWVFSLAGSGKGGKVAPVPVATER